MFLQNNSDGIDIVENYETVKKMLFDTQSIEKYLSVRQLAVLEDRDKYLSGEPLSDEDNEWMNASLGKIV